MPTQTVLNFSICEGSTCDSINFNELTGIYASPSNTSGWGSPNENIYNATASTLTITFPDGTVKIIDTFHTSPQFPTMDPTLVLSIPSTQLGFTTGSIPDGIYTFLYTVTITDNTGVKTYTQTIQKAFFCNSKCCVYSMAKDIDVDCNCFIDKIDSIAKAFVMLKGLEANAGCGNLSNFNNILSQINKLCAGSSCSNCK